MAAPWFARFTKGLSRALGIEALAERRARAILLRLCFGDAGAVERLIAGEQSRARGISSLEACRRAIRRLQRDNR
jgi:hypothetical protein